MKNNSMKERSSWFHGMCCLIVSASLVGAFPMPVFSQGDLPRVTNIRTQVSDQTVYVYYSLIGSPERVYNVSLVLKKHSSPDFSYSPKTISGDYGQNVFVGTDWRIAWSFVREFPEGLDFDDYYFDVRAEASSSEPAHSGLNTTWLIAGGAVVVGGVVGLLLMNKSAAPTVNGGGGGGGVFPVPPARPQ